MPLGPVDPDLLRRLQKSLSRHLPLTIRILPSKPLPPQAYHVVRHQYHSTGLLEYLLNNDDEDSYRILGVTAADLYIPIFTFVFGEAQLEGKAAVISLFRPSGAGTMRVPRQTLIQRLTKLGVHELGHTFGLGHCRQPGCLMGFAENLAKLDNKDMELCSYCRVLLEDYLRNDLKT